MKKSLLISLLLFCTALTILFVQQIRLYSQATTSTTPPQSQIEHTLLPQSTTAPVEEVRVVAPPATKALHIPSHSYQSFNNCGPATLSSVLSYYDINKSQQELGQIMRPYQNPQGDNDDKATFPQEMAEEAQRNNLAGIQRVNGTIEILETLIANNIPIIVETLLNANEDIGHYKIVYGYDRNSQTLNISDSYYGPHRTENYQQFLKNWQPFNYQYILAFSPNQEALVKAILAEEYSEKIAWIQSGERAQQEIQQNPNDNLAQFNLVRSLYYQEKYAESIQLFEQIQTKLPRRMLWYQTEPIMAYQKLKQYNTALSLINNILTNNNKAYSELYYLRGQIYQEQGELAKARQEYQTAIVYNTNFEPAQAALQQL